jgi:hypothetical protein
MKMAVSLTCVLMTCAAGGTVLAQGVGSELKPIAFSTLDTNKDGRISRSEAHADPELEMEFDMLDVNHDGFLSPAEFQAWPRALKTNASRHDPSTGPGGSAGAQHMPGQ